MDVAIPSPSAFLHNSPVLKPTPDVPLTRPVKPRNSASSKAAIEASRVQDGGITKPKQSKSRNGCMTCKKKRLKCDETHPICQQCTKRNVQCEGYRKDFKWRQFEEASFNPNKPANRSKKSTGSVSFTPHGSQSQSLPQNGEGNRPGQVREHSPSLDLAFASAAHAIQGDGSPSGQKKKKQEKTSPPQLTANAFNLPPYDPSVGDVPDGLDPYSAPNTNTTSKDDGSGRSAGSTLSSGSPNLANLCLPDTDFNSPPDPSELRPPISPLPYQPTSFDSPNFDPTLPNDEDFDEEVVRQPSFMTDIPDLEDMSNWTFRHPSPVPSEVSSTSSRSSSMTILAQPKFDAASPEMLALRFDRHTCGILSVKDGPHENPWRNLIWPLGRDSPALYHAINSMIAFHGATDVPNLRMHGMAHMTQSIKKLSQEMGNMRLDAALATSLALAFSDGWDHHTTTGIQHLRGAKFMVDNAMVKHRQDIHSGRLTPQDAMRLKFLCNTYVYMNVIARLTSLEEAHDFDLGELVATLNPPTPEPMEVDPLMGCAVDLFPLIGRVANLIQRVRKTAANSLTTVSQAIELKEQLEQWTLPPSPMYERPEDVTSEVQHSIQTADAYRYAALLYLHQAVPEIESPPSHELAARVLINLAKVPVTSRTIIVQIFPLLAAGCEVTSEEDRNWVLQRWLSMIMRLRIGNVERCVDIIKEVWKRRDEHETVKQAYEVERQNRLLRRYNACVMANGDFMPPMLNPGKRKAQSIEESTEAAFIGGVGDGMDDDIRPMKRRVTFGAMNLTMPLPMTGSMPLLSPGGSHRMGDLEVDRNEPEYTVRGQLHWLGVMADQGWEVFLG